mmetsp:Transcript_18186/g.47401  ORF Transcript_18186/g.47401 Transcript_18186/m.47401 type:complete len:230 (-) Transcript_18186:334-1023(-)
MLLLSTQCPPITDRLPTPALSAFFFLTGMPISLARLASFTALSLALRCIPLWTSSGSLWRRGPFPPSSCTRPASHRRRALASIVPARILRSSCVARRRSRSLASSSVSPSSGVAAGAPNRACTFATSADMNIRLLFFSIEVCRSRFADGSSKTTTSTGCRRRAPLLLAVVGAVVGRAPVPGLAALAGAGRDSWPKMAATAASLSPLAPSSSLALEATSPASNEPAVAAF